MKFVKDSIKEVVGMGKEVEDVNLVPIFEEKDGVEEMVREEPNCMFVNYGVMITTPKRYFGEDDVLESWRDNTDLEGLQDSKEKVGEGWNENRIGLLFGTSLMGRDDGDQDFQLLTIEQAKDVLENLRKAIDLAQTYQFEDLFVDGTFK